MKITKKQSDFGMDIFLEEENKYLAFYFGGNGDLYWSIHNRKQPRLSPNHESFVITKENYGVYSLFEKLYSDIENINLFDLDDMYIPSYIETKEELAEYLREEQERIENQKKEYREYNYSHYNELFDKENKTITWYSDETNRICSNYLKIKKEKDSFVVDFFTQPHIKGYDEDSYSDYYISIRFRNSGSVYDPFNIVFMRMYNALPEVDDVKDDGHQIHIAEYLYEQEQKRLLKK